VSPLPFPVAEPASVAPDHAQALSALYAEHGARIHRFLRDLLGDATLAKDATQETFVRAYKKLPLFDPTINKTLDHSCRGSAEGGTRDVAPWLFGIARNVSLELRKSRARAGKYFVAAAADAAGTDCPEREYLRREALRVVGAALEQLPEERRAMLILRLDHGLSYDDIALTMGCSLAKVKVEIFRAREVLRDVMTSYQGGPR